MSAVDRLVADADDALGVVTPLISRLERHNVVMMIQPVGANAAEVAAMAARAMRAEASHEVPTKGVAIVVLQTERNMAVPHLRRAACAVRHEWRRRTDDPVWIGVAHAPVGNRHADARAAATVALELGRVLWPNGNVILEEDVWPYQPLLRDRSMLDRLADLAEDLEAFDAVNGTSLLVTLEAFYDASLSQIVAARRLRVHRHTIAGRLDQIDTLLGRSVREGPDRLLLEMAVKARRLRMWLEGRPLPQVR